jgi:hypothetical protein
LISANGIGYWISSSGFLAVDFSAVSNTISPLVMV